jgi:drug/metabolite transporter (DMT)-like permease
VLMELRVLLAVVARRSLRAIAVSRLPKLPFRWKEFLLLGTLKAAIPFTLIAASEIKLTAFLAAILYSTALLFTPVVAAAWIRDGLTVRRIAGLVLGVVGV